MSLINTKNMSFIKKITALVLITALILGFPLLGPAKAETLKEEIAYVRLFNDGSLDKIYIVNSFELGDNKQILDYGNYAYVKNLTNSDPIKLQNGTVTLNAKGDRLYYEGFLLDAQLPWIISINYWLDGKKIAPGDLGGQSGRLKITINTEENPLGSRDFFDKYCLQIGITLDADLCCNIEAESATLASAGSNKQINFLALPARASYGEITADVKDFKMTGITLSGIAMDMNMDSNFDDMDMADIHKLIDALAELDDGVQELLDGIFEMEDGAAELHKGTLEFADGSGDLAEGVYELSDGSGQISDGAGKLKDGARDITEGAFDFADGIEKLRDGVIELDDGTGELEDGGYAFYAGTAKLHKSTKELYGGINELNEGAGNLAAGAEELSLGLNQAASGGQSLTNGFEAYFNALLYMANAQLAPAGIEVGRDNYEEVILEYLYGSAISAARANIYAALNERRGEILAGILAQMELTSEEYELLPPEIQDQINQEVENIILGMAEEALEEQMELIKAGAEAEGAQLLGVLELLKNYDTLLSGLKTYSLGINGLSGGAGSLAAGISAFHSGLNQYTNGMGEYTEGVKTFAQNAGELAEGISDLKNGTLELKDGTIELHDGFREFRDGIVKLQDGIIELFDGIIELHDGIIELYDGTLELKDGALKLTDATGQLLDGIRELYDGVEELKDGTYELRQNTANLDTDIIDGIKESLEDLFGKNIPVKSFVSEKNTEIKAVQFIMQTQGISAPEAEKIEPEVKPKFNLWQRFIRLFGF